MVLNPSVLEWAHVWSLDRRATARPLLQEMAHRHSMPVKAASYIFSTDCLTATESFFSIKCLLNEWNFNWLITFSSDVGTHYLISFQNSDINSCWCGIHCVCSCLFGKEHGALIPLQFRDTAQQTGGFNWLGGFLTLNLPLGCLSMPRMLLACLCMRPWWWPACGSGCACSRAGSLRRQTPDDSTGLSLQLSSAGLSKSVSGDSGSTAIKI